MHALNYLQGIEFNPVQRNKGIDAILVQQFENSPVLVRVQKYNETLEQAALKTKNSKKSILIKTSQEEDLFEAMIDFAGMEIVLSPGNR